MVVSTEKRALALRLRKSTSLSTRAIASQVNAADSTVQRWLKGIPAGKEASQNKVRQVTLRHTSSPASSDSPFKRARQGKATNDSLRQNKAVKRKLKSLSTGKSIMLVFIILVVCVLFVWIYLFPETKAKDKEETLPEKTFGFEGESVEDLGMSIDELPQNQFG